MEMQLKPIRAQINKWHDLLLLYFLNEEEDDEKLSNALKEGRKIRERIKRKDD